MTSQRSTLMSKLHKAGLGLVAASALLAAQSPAFARGAGIRDAEVERILRKYSDPIFKAGGLDEKAVHVYIINDESLNAFVAGGQNVFLHTGMIMTLDTPNELKGVIAHETGHRFSVDTVSHRRSLLGLKCPHRNCWTVPLRRWRPW